jgi:hypothetical protein
VYGPVAFITHLALILNSLSEKTKLCFKKFSKKMLFILIIKKKIRETPLIPQ